VAYNPPELVTQGLVRSGDERDPCEGFRFVSDHQASYPIVTMCKLLGVSSSGMRGCTAIPGRKPRWFLFLN
jgi:hypothetical protein